MKRPIYVTATAKPGTKKRNHGSILRWSVARLMCICATCLIICGCESNGPKIDSQPTEKSKETRSTGPAGKPNEGLKIVRLKVGQNDTEIEIADTEETRSIGMMYRDSNPEHHGMIFVFQDVDYRRFWMKNTRIPLDIAYVAEDGTINDIHQMKPYITDGTRSQYKAKYALEMNEGWFEQHGVKAGTVLDLSALKQE